MISRTSYTASLTVPQSADEVYAAVREPQGWWNSNITGNVENVGDEFRHEAHGLHEATLRVTVAESGRRIVWHVLSSEMSMLDDTTEWVNTDLVFDIDSDDAGTTLRFTHSGLLPGQECYDICENAWGEYMASLHQRITTGTGRPNEGDSVALEDAPWSD